MKRLTNKPSPNSQLDPYNQILFSEISDSFKPSNGDENQKSSKIKSNKGFLSLNRFCRRYKYAKSTVYKHKNRGTIPSSKILPKTPKTPTIRVHKSAAQNLIDAGIKPRGVRSRVHSKDQTNVIKNKLMRISDDILIKIVDQKGMSAVLDVLCKIEDNTNE